MSLSVLFFASLALAQGASESLERDARSAMKSGRFKEAAIKFQDAAASAGEASRRAKMELQAGYSHFNDRNLKGAREAARRAFSADPDLEIVPEFVPPDFVRLVDDEKRARPTPPPAPADLAELKRVAAEKLADGHAEEVVYDLGNVPKEKLDAECWILLARAYEALGKSSLAEQARRAAVGGTSFAPAPPSAPALTMPPASPNASGTRPTNTADLLSAGRAAIARGDAFAAQSAANRALELQPNSSAAYGLLGDALLAKGERELAEANWKQSLRYDEKNEDALLSLSDYEIGQGAWASGIEHLHRAAELNPQNAGRLLALGRRLRKQGDLVHARQVFASAATIQPVDAGTFTEYASLLLQANDADAALDPLMKASSAEPKRAVLHTNLAAVLRQKGMLKEAEREYREALRVEPEYVAAAKGLGILLLGSGNPTDAAELFKTASTKDPSDIDSLLGCARSLRLSGRPEEAASLLEKASSAEDAAILTEAAAAAYERGRFADAEQLWARAQTRNPSDALVKANREKATSALAFLKAAGTQPPILR